MAHGHKSDEKIVYVGDSRVIKKTQEQRLIPKDYSAYPGKSEAFIPNFLLKEWMVGVVVLVGMLVLVMSDPAPLGYPADPKNTAFHSDAGLVLLIHVSIVEISIYIG